jgi:H+-translocating NAD(P) transhydrogenase subunit alpha
MIVGVGVETWPGERRVALVPGLVPGLKKAGLDVVVEAGAGALAGFPDGDYKDKGARIEGRAAIGAADVLLQVRSLAARPDGPPPGLDLVRRGQAVIGFLDPVASPLGIGALSERGATALSMELMPRITRAQSMDALSSTATVVGYKAVLLAAEALPRMFPMLMTAAGTVASAKVFVVGAGVAGLSAIATARRLGATVEAYDVRPAVKEQVLSLGAKFVELPLEAGSAEGHGGYAREMDEAFYRKQRETMARVVAASDVVITAAAVPGRKAPVLVTSDMVAAMRPGSVVVDLAAEQGGNCESTVPGENVVRGGVTVMGPLNLAASVPYHASQLYAKNIVTFLLSLVKGGRLALDPADDIVRETLVIREGEVIHPRVREALGLPLLYPAAPA